MKLNTKIVGIVPIITGEYFMRKVIFTLSFLTLIMMSGCSKNNDNNAANIIINYLNTCEQGTRYGIYDINKDGNIELLTAKNDSHADSVTVCTLDAKTNKLTELGTFGSFGNMTIYPETGYIESYYLGQGITDITIYEIAGDNINTLATFWTNDGTLAETYEYKVNELSVSEEEYYEAYNKYSSTDSLNLNYADFAEYVDYETNYKDVCEQISIYFLHQQVSESVYK